MRKIERIGTIRGDFKILELVGLSHYKCQCIHCGAIREYSVGTVAYGKVRCSCPHEVEKVCIQCKNEFKTSKNARFCSPGCKAAYYAERKKKMSIYISFREIIQGVRLIQPRGCLYVYIPQKD